MKRLFVLLMLTASVALSCTKFDDSLIWDKLNNHEDRISELERQCRQMNTNIEALQTILEALQDNEYVTSVTPIVEDGVEIGYTITFSSGKNITIYHGKNGEDGAPGQDGADGKDGTDGQDGAAPIIGVAQDTDGIYYWTVNGSWLLDADGNKVKAVGTDGQDGADGAPGQDGVTPQLKIENGLWYVSYDDGSTWLEMGQATGDQGPQGETGAQGPQGVPGVSGDSMFSDLDYSSSPDYVTFTLADGTQIKVPTWSAFEALRELCTQMNSNIEALQTIMSALQNNDYVKNITPIYDGTKEIGYIIEFTKSGKVTIYHGADGKDGVAGAPGQDGEDGQDGAAPIIGVAQDTDGIYYWTVNGSWLLDADGNKVKAVGADGQDGSDGADGSNGTDGNDGVTPQLKTENGLWYVSYDGGSTWLEMGQATGDQGPQGETGAQGPQGAPGVGGDSMFSDLDYSSSPDYVTFTLADGTQIKVPTWSAFEALKELCTQMNSNIEALQTIVSALQNNDYVKSVTAIYEGADEIGYVIEFTKSGKVTIYHGADGKDGVDGAPGQDGEDGQDGATPIIGVAQDTDGIYYWTVNGSWLLDAGGNKVKAVGTDGQDGADGAPGQDGVTPQLKIENGLWYVSYDDGSTWLEMGQATGDQGPQGETGAQGPQGPAGSDGADGDSFFQSVTETNDYVTFTLADGTQIKVPTWSAFEALKELCTQMNSNIEALQTIVSALQNNDYVKNITPIYDGTKEIGYIIEFTKSGKVTIYHGADGKDGVDGAPGQDGEDGQDGAAPIIGVAQDTDGIYYWTVNGSWLLDADGNKVKAVGTDGQDGADGAPGQDGSDGADGVTPQLKIENGLWYVSYDDGSTWLEMGQATGNQGPQGSAGSDGADGDSFFQSVTETNDYVSMVLADGTEIKIPKYSAVAATLVLDNVTGFTATFNGEVVRNTMDLKVTVYYGTTDNLTVYKNKGSVSVTEFDGSTFTLKLTGLAANTTYYYFSEVISNGTATFSGIASFRTGEEDSYVDWEEGENVGGDI